jgi:radical SAM family uncharacterized protein
MAPADAGTEPSGLWERLAPLLRNVERPARYIDSEYHAGSFGGAGYRVALVYPDTYELGMSNQALGILADRLRTLDDVGVERAFVPWRDMAAAMRSAGAPLATLESCVPLADCDLVGITLPHELACTNVLETLDLSGIPIRASERCPSDPLVVGGGPGAYNPEPVAAFFDAILVGEGEDAVCEIVEAHREARRVGLDRGGVLERLAAVRGVYVPSLYRMRSGGDGSGLEATRGAPPVVQKRVVADLDAVPTPACPVVPFMDVVHDRASVEVLRGCTRGCRFCQAGMVYRPVRERTADSIVRDAMGLLRCTGYDEVSLTSLSTADHSTIEEVALRLRRRLEGTDVSVSIPSTRVDAFGVRLARMIGAGRKTGLTLAPEAGTQRLRDAVNKCVSDEDLLNAVQTAFEAGWRRVKLYFMIGLPTETDADVAGIGGLVGRVLTVADAAVPSDQRGQIRVSVSVATFVPKAHTPFQWESQPTLEEIGRRHRILKDAVPRKRVELSWHDPAQSFVEAVLARGGRELADAIEHAWRAGAAFDAWTDEFALGRWTEAFESAGVDAVAVASGERAPGDALPWSHVSSGVETAFLVREREAALAGRRTPDCASEACSACGVCDVLGVEVATERPRRG